MRAFTILNPASSSHDAARAALSAAGVTGPVETVRGVAIPEAVREAVDAGAELVIAAGGDGTASAAAGALVGTKAALGILPTGTLNHLARDLGIPANLFDAADLIARGKARRIDVAEVNGRVFINNAAIGLYPLMLVDREAQRRRLGRSKRLAMLVATLRTMTRFHAHRLLLSADGGEARVDTPLLFVGNNDYRLAIPGAGRRERVDGGELCVLVMRSKSLRGSLAATARALLSISRANEMVRLEGVKALRVDSRRRYLNLAIDGETVRLEPPLDFRIRPKALKVIAPR